MHAASRIVYDWCSYYAYHLLAVACGIIGHRIYRAFKNKGVSK